MTELEKIERAKIYIEKLANGVNPLDDSIIPDTDIVNNVRLSRCFFYISDILRQIVENGGIQEKKPKKRDRVAFLLPIEKRQQFEFSDEPIPISVLTKQINALIDTDTMIPLKYGCITNWLLSIGMMYIPSSDSNTHIKLPTEEGKKIGIIAEPRSGINGPYTSVTYSRDAQSFILDNIDAVIEFRAPDLEMQGKPWAAQQDQYLRELFDQGLSVSEIAGKLQRNNGAIRARLKKLGLDK